MRIELFSHHAFEAIVKIQNSSAQAAAWSEADYQRLTADPEAMVLVAVLEGTTPPEIIGFAAFHRVGEEAELWNLAVAPQHRRQGVAKALFQEACRRLVRAGATRLFLEVRASNAPALAFYRAAGFKTLTRRKEYYQNPNEDALVLACQLVPELAN
ncbi:MAG: ribosomal protein S18-alanine N-acetyltransferase [Acidobacteria bacterium]|nr:ribosomal protein S18-alanine N-acetyltransferase [Acidobacteriota bacterium]